MSRLSRKSSVGGTDKAGQQGRERPKKARYSNGWWEHGLEVGWLRHECEIIIPSRRIVRSHVS